MNPVTYSLVPAGLAYDRRELYRRSWRDLSGRVGWRGRARRWRGGCASAGGAGGPAGTRRGPPPPPPLPPPHCCYLHSSLICTSSFALLPHCKGIPSIQHSSFFREFHSFLFLRNAFGFMQDRAIKLIVFIYNPRGRKIPIDFNMLEHLDLTVLVTLNMVALTFSEAPVQKMPTLGGVETVNIESKDRLLQMLEKKIKEIKENKKHKNGNDFLPKNADFNLKSNGISNVGEAELLMRYGKNGQGTVNMTAEGISNLGKVQMLVGSGDNGLFVPGLSNLFIGSPIRSDDKNDQNQLLVSQNDVNIGFRRQTNISRENETSDKVLKVTDTVQVNKDEKPKENAQTSIVTDKSDSISNVTPKSNNSSSPVNGTTVPPNPVVTENNTASNKSLASSDPATKSDTVTASTTVSNGDILNKVM